MAELISGSDFNAAALSRDILWRDAYDREVKRTYAQKHRTIKEAMLALTEEGGSSLPLIHYKGACITRGEADVVACRLGNALLQTGLEKGDRVSIVVSNRPEVVCAFMACYKAGFIAAAYNQRCTEREIVHSVAGVCSRALLIEKATLPKIMPDLAAGALPSLKAVVVIDAEAGEDFDLLLMTDFDTFVESGAQTEPEVEIDPDDGAILLFTGGTTGVSKGCCQSHGRMVLELESMAYWCASALKATNPCFLVCMPMTHIMGINYGVNWQLINGGCVAIAAGNKPPDIMTALRLYEPDAWATLPTLLHSVSGEDELAHTPYKDLDLVIFGGSFISRETLLNLSGKTGAAFVESYGMSESFGFVTCNPVGSGGKMGSIGLPMSNTDMLIVDMQTGERALPVGERGEIIFRGPQIIREYWNNPKETAVALRGGWLYSGDIGYMDEDGYFYLVDRKKDTIVVSGFNVFPKEIDELLIAHPDILDACTVGVPDEHSGERPKSYIVAREGAEIQPEDVISYCKEYLVAYKAPKYVEMVDEIPKTKARKPDRELLKRRAPSTTA